VSATFRISGPAGIREVQLPASGAWKIGRDHACTIVLEDDAVSRQHALVQSTEKGEYYLIDLGSLNGTYLNGARVSTPTELRDGGQVRVGLYGLEFHCDSPAPPLDETVTNTTGFATRPLYAQRLVSVLVVDVRGYTRLAQVTDHAILCQLIGTWFREAGRIMERHGAWAQKYIGDAVMAVWLHEPAGNRRGQIMRILRATAELARATARLQPRFSLPQPVRVGAGINTGMASVGNTGTGGHTDYTAIGEAVNAAFRIESCTRQLGCDLAIGSATLEALCSCGAWFEQHSVELKGYDGPATVWTASFQGLDELLAAFPTD
jgi:adenylate cyclase